MKSSGTLLPLLINHSSSSSSFHPYNYHSLAMPTGEGSVGVISVERRNADGVDKFLELAKRRMDVRHVKEEKDLKWHIYELRHLQK